MTNPNQVGSYNVFMPFPSDTEQNAGLVVEGTVDLTKSLNHNAAAAHWNTANHTGVVRFVRDSVH